jgi:glycerol-3-phosphate acyltransferase PlsY
MYLAMVAVLVCLCAYLLGSIPFGLLIAHFRRVDLRSVGSGNIGATNAARALGKGWGILVLLLDASKAALPAYLCLHLCDSAGAKLAWDRVCGALTPETLAGLATAAAAAAFFGHLYPLFAGFRGGKGVATALGGFLALEPRAALLGALVYALAYGLTRISSVGSLLGVLSFPLWLYLTDGKRPSYLLSGVMLLFILLRHRDNIRRLLSRKEQRV